jgi:uncharacterized protein (DUF1778 family)
VSPRAKKRTGRPALAKGEAKDSILQVRLTHADREAVARAARASAKKVSEWVREALLAGLGRAASP